MAVIDMLAEHADQTNLVDRCLLDGADDRTCLIFDGPLTYDELRGRVGQSRLELTSAGLRPGGSVAIQLPPGPAFVVNLLAAWRIGAQVLVLDHRLTPYEVEQATSRVETQLLLSPAAGAPAPLRGFTTADAVLTHLPGRPAQTPHALLQLSSGSTGPSKVIGRTAAGLMAELERYRQIAGSPEPGERIVLLASMVHVLGLVGGLLHGLHTGCAVVLPQFLTADAVLAAITGGPEPATVLGVPFHLQLLAAAAGPARLPQLKRMTVGGEPVRPPVRKAFTDRYQVPLGVMYGMTEAGVIATDMFGEHQPALTPAPGTALREVGGQLLLAAAVNPYVGATAPGRWLDGWLHTRDAGTMDPATGLVTVHGRLDAMVSIGGLKVDLAEIEQTLADLPQVAEAVVVYDGEIKAFVALEHPASVEGLTAELAKRLAAYKQPRQLSVIDRLPRTASGKLIRDGRALLSAAADQATGSRA